MKLDKAHYSLKLITVSGVLINIGDFFDVCRLHSQQSKDVAANKAWGPEVRDGHYGADISYRTDRNRFRLSDTEHCAGKVGSANN